jgi:hypothetical protein
VLTRINQMSTSSDIYINDIVLFLQARSARRTLEKHCAPSSFVINTRASLRVDVTLRRHLPPRQLACDPIPAIGALLPEGRTVGTRGQSSLYRRHVGASSDRRLDSATSTTART